MRANTIWRIIFVHFWNGRQTIAVVHQIISIFHEIKKKMRPYEIWQAHRNKFGFIYVLKTNVKFAFGYFHTESARTILAECMWKSAGEVKQSQKLLLPGMSTRQAKTYASVENRKRLDSNECHFQFIFIHMFKFVCFSCFTREE